MRGYTKQEIIKLCQKGIENPDSFYKQNFVNYRGKCKDCAELYTEVIADYLLQNLDKFKIKTISRARSSYKVPTHKGVINENSNREEEKMAIRMYNQTYKEYGKVVDYQIPLKNLKHDKGLGKIDLMSLKDNTLYLLELKRGDSKETLLRCVLEIYTYICRVDHIKLLKDYDLKTDTRLVAAPLVYEKGYQYIEFLEDNHNKVKELMNKLNVHRPFTY